MRKKSFKVSPGDHILLLVRLIHVHVPCVPENMYAVHVTAKSSILLDLNMFFLSLSLSVIFTPSLEALIFLVRSCLFTHA